MMKYEIVAFYKQEIEEIRECAENIGRLYGWRYRCEKIAENYSLHAWERIVFFVC